MWWRSRKGESAQSTSRASRNGHIFRNLWFIRGARKSTAQSTKARAGIMMAAVTMRVSSTRSGCGSGEKRSWISARFASAPRGTAFALRGAGPWEGPGDWPGWLEIWTRVEAEERDPRVRLAFVALGLDIRLVPNSQAKRRWGFLPAGSVPRFVQREQRIGIRAGPGSPQTWGWRPCLPRLRGCD